MILFSLLFNSCFNSVLLQQIKFILLQDLIQKYEGDLSQLSKRCDEMKKLYSNVLVHIILKCNENKATFLFKKGRKEWKGVQKILTCFIFILAVGTERKSHV